ncbi:MAG: MFS transporter [Aquisalimonadaceae bacterium]
MNEHKTGGPGAFATPADRAQGHEPRSQPWMMAVVGLFIVMVVIAFGRLAFGMLLPEMRASLDLSYRQGGYLAAASGLGYLITVMPAGVMAARWGGRNTILLGMVLVTLSFFGLTLSSHYLLLFGFMAMLGMGSAFAQISQVALVAGWFVERRGAALGLISSGGGLGLLIIGLLVPFLAAHYGDVGWRLAWGLFGVLSMIVAGLVLLCMSDPPVAHGRTRLPSSNWDVYRNPRVLRVAILYGIIGTTYIVQAVFMVSFMLSEGVSAHTAGTIVAVFGILGLFAGPVWGVVSDTLGRSRALILCLATVIIATMLPLLMANTLTFALHYVLLGCSLGGLFPLSQAATTEQVTGSEVPVALGFANLLFAIGQLVGPVMAGWLIDLTGGFRVGFWITCVLMMIGMVLASRIGRADGVGH